MSAISTNQFSVLEIRLTNIFAVETPKKRFLEVIKNNISYKVKHFDNISKITEPGNLTIIATYANTRESIFYIAFLLGYKYIILISNINTIYSRV